MLKGGHKKFWGSFNTGAWSFSHSDGGAKSSNPIRGGGVQQVLPCLEGGAQKVSDPIFSHFVAPLPVINDQSLIIYMHNAWLVPGRRGWNYACCTSGHYKILCYACWQESPINQGPMLIFHDLFFQIIRKMSWIQIFKIKYEVTSSAHTFGS